MLYSCYIFQKIRHYIFPRVWQWRCAAVARSVLHVKVWTDSSILPHSQYESWLRAKLRARIFT